MKKILVLFGGCSPEYVVSLQSAYSVLRHMDRERYRPIPVGITQAGDWFLYTGKWEAIPAGTWQERPCPPLSPPTGGITGCWSGGAAVWKSYR